MVDYRIKKNIFLYIIESEHPIGISNFKTTFRFKNIK